MPVSIYHIYTVLILIAAAILARFNLRGQLWTQPFRWPPIAAMSYPDHIFSPERCADLYNSLFQKAIANDPSAVVERNLIARFLEAAPEFAEIPNLESLPLYSFLSRLDTTFLPHRRIGPLTPEIYQPNPAAFWSGAFSHVEGIVLLFGQKNEDSPMDGGFFLDLQTCRGVWHWSPGPFPASEKWVSLEFVLQSQIDKWESGRFYWDGGSQSLAIKRWVESDVTDALTAWDRLLSAIEAKIPQGGQSQSIHLRLEPLNLESMSSFGISTFSRAFLSRAPRPRFKHIAPGVSAFSPDTLNEIYSSESPDSFRRSFNLGDPDEEDWASLIFPASSSVPRDVSQNFDIKSFDEDWGYGKFTVNRRAGLYTEPDSIYSDGVRLIANSGQPTAFQFNGRCPWGPSRPPHLSEVLLHWASLVEIGTWTVDTDGVANDNDWFDANIHQTKLDWDSI